MLLFIHMPAHADSIAQGEAVWVLDPAVPGPDVPDRGSSLFDKITLDAHGQRHIPYPFEHLVARIEAAADCNAAQPCTRTVLIPLGRSLQRAAASPDFFAHPRRVLAVTEEGSGTLLRDRLYLGFQERASTLEVISYNEAQARFEFQIVSNYALGKVPEVSSASRVMCIACHQNQGPIFSEAMWLETNANPRIAAALKSERQVASAAAVPTDVTQAVDNATDRANRMALTQWLWRNACGDGTKGEACRRAVIKAGLQFALSGERSYAASDPRFKERVLNRFATRATTQWSQGIALASADIPNRDPFDVFQGVTGRSLVDIPLRFDPLVPRSPEHFSPSAGELANDLVRGVSAFISQRVRNSITHALATSHAELREITSPCTFESNQSVRFDCVRDSTIRLRGTLHGTHGELEEIAIDAEEPTRNLQMLQLQNAGHVQRFGVKQGNGNARLSNGRSIERIDLRPQDQNSSASIWIRQDFDRLDAAVDSLSADTLTTEYFETLNALIGGKHRVTEQPALAPHKSTPASDPSTDRLALLFEAPCGGCHRTQQASPPNFLSGNTKRIHASLRKCAPRMLVRLSMNTLDASLRTKSPMPPETASLSPPSHTQAERAVQSKLIAAVEDMLREEYGRVPAVDELLNRGYESLRTCSSEM
ncbi:MAG: hypothetical protein ACJ8OJ_13970 [Povalibacter sp.]